MSATAPQPSNSDSSSSSITIRQARDADATAIRLLVTQALLAAELDAPTVEADTDLIEAGYYREPGRGMWVAVEDERIIGCAAIDLGEDGHATLRRLAGISLANLTAAAVAFAQGRGYRGVETVLPTAMSDAREAVTTEGFLNDATANDLLFRRTL
ncbi:MAG: hypothetical protein HOH95_15070 [Dehalococcoidia bacterium]|mgnify:CR=1 FL=1|jgi:hypothetical protein|nr:hypothetical protein [Dehalococcoidia bacterium]